MRDLRESYETIHHRLYIAGLSHDCTEEKLRHVFSKYGSVRDIQIISYTQMKKSARQRDNDPIAFITFETNEAVEAILQAHRQRVFEKLSLFVALEKAAEPAKRRRQDDVFRQIEDYCQKSNLLLQVNTTHLDRMMDFLRHEMTTGNLVECEIIGTSKAVTPYQCSSFIYVHTSSSAKVEEQMNHYLYSPKYHIVSRCALIKIYRVDQLLTIPFQWEESRKAKHLILKTTYPSVSLSEPSDYQSPIKNTTGAIVVKVEAYPSKLLQKNLVEALDQFIQEHATLRTLTMSTDANTHLLSVVQLYSPPKITKSHELEYDLYMTGISPSLSLTKKQMSCMAPEYDKDDILCRAYYKLEEALAAYRREYDISFDEFEIAFDCGSSPGGWTKYLVESVKCKKVYSCDPGMLDPTIVSLQGVEFLNMRGHDGISLVQEKGDWIDLWVSDMCLADFSDQVNHLCLAFENGILTSKAMFVLTIKCNMGHSKTTFDRIAQKEFMRLQEKLKVTNLHLCHLFSNRKGERTVMGRLQS